MGGFLTVCLAPTLQRTLRFPRFLKGEVNRSEEYRIDASGKGVNVTRVLLQLGQEATHLTHLGGRERERFLSLASQDDIPIRWVDSASEIRSCYTVIDDAESLTTELVEEALPVAAETEEALRELYLSLLGDHHTVIISGAKSRGYSDEIFPWMVGEAKGAGAAVIADYRGADLRASLAAKPDLIKPNFDEFVSTFLSGVRSSPFGPDRATAGVQERSDGELEEAVRERMRRIAGEGIAVVLTRGSAPTLYALPGGQEGERAPIGVDPLNTIGCGDAFTAGFAAQWRESGEFDAALEQGHVCASINATLLRPGVIR